MKCKQCGKINLGGGNFCEYCGTALKKQSLTEEQKKMINAKQYDKDIVTEIDTIIKKKAQKSNIFIVLSAILVAISISYYFLYRPVKKQADLKDCYAKAIKIAGWDGKGALPIYRQSDFKSANDLCINEKGY